MTLYTSIEKTKILKMAFGYLAAAIFMALFGGIYEIFSHQVYSYYMIYAFGFPLVMGLLPALAIVVFDLRIPEDNTIRLWNYGVATLTIGSAMKGVIDIYGTTNRLMIVYPLVAVILIIAAVIHGFITRKV